MDGDDLRFFDNVVNEFQREKWTAHQLEVAALMARAMSDLQRDQALLRAEGTVLANDRGQPIVNPRRAVVTSGMAGILALRRTLQLDVIGRGAGSPLKPKENEKPIGRNEIKINLADALKNLN